MVVSSSEHLSSLVLVSPPEGSESAMPADDLGMPRVAPPLVKHNVPDGVKLPVLCEEVVPAKAADRQVPHAHEGSQ